MIRLRESHVEVVQEITDGSIPGDPRKSKPKIAINLEKG